MVNNLLLICFLILSIVAVFVLLYPLRKGKNRVTTMLLVLVFLVLPMLGYLYWGAGSEWNKYQDKLAKQEQVNVLVKSVNGDPHAIINKLKKRLQQQPNSAEGWYLLGRLYASQDDWQHAYHAYNKAHDLAPTNEKIVINYAQSMWQLNRRQFNPKIRALFQSVLQKNKHQPDALAMLAMDAFVGHAYQQAIDYWQRLLNIVPPESEDASSIRKAIVKAQQRML